MSSYYSPEQIAFIVESMGIAHLSANEQVRYLQDAQKWMGENLDGLDGFDGLDGLGFLKKIGKSISKAGKTFVKPIGKVTDFAWKSKDVIAMGAQFVPGYGTAIAAGIGAASMIENSDKQRRAEKRYEKEVASQQAMYSASMAQQQPTVMPPPSSAIRHTATAEIKQGLGLGGFDWKIALALAMGALVVLKG